MVAECSSNTSYTPLWCSEVSYSPWLIKEEIDDGLFFNQKRCLFTSVHLCSFIEWLEFATEACHWKPFKTRMCATAINVSHLSISSYL